MAPLPWRHRVTQRTGVAGGLTSSATCRMGDQRTFHTHACARAAAGASGQDNPGTAHSHGGFRLRDSFVRDYAAAVPPFGFNGLGEMVYKRTYARQLQTAGSSDMGAPAGTDLGAVRVPWTVATPIPY